VFADSGRPVAFSPVLNAVRQTSESIDALVEVVETQSVARRFTIDPGFSWAIRNGMGTPDDNKKNYLRASPT
jgi:hypothetical protein